MTPSALITYIATKKPHGYGNQDVLDWINEVELDAGLYVDPAYIRYEIQRIAAQDEYDLPAGVTVSDVNDVYSDGIRLPHLDARAADVYGWWKGSTTAKIVIYPEPTTTDASDDKGLAVVYRSRPSAKLLANITTDTLSLPDQHKFVYVYYIFAQIDMCNQDMDSYSNSMVLYNSAMQAYREAVKREQPETPLQKSGFINAW